MANIEELYAKHYQALRSYAYWLCRDVTQSEDLVQEAFAAAVKKSSEVSVKWLITVVRYRNIDAFYKKKPGLLEDTELLSDDCPKSDVLAEVSELRDSIEDAVRALPQSHKAAFILYAQGKSMREIGAVLEIPANTAQTWVFRARMKLQESLREYK